MTTALELEAARDLWKKAKHSAVYEHRALSLLVTARKDTLESYDNAPAETASRKGTEQYRKQLSDHVARVQAALLHLDKTAMNFDAVQARRRESERAFAVAPASPRPVLYPATVVYVDKK